MMVLEGTGLEDGPAEIGGEGQGAAKGGCLPWGEVELLEDFLPVAGLLPGYKVELIRMLGDPDHFCGIDRLKDGVPYCEASEDGFAKDEAGDDGDDEQEGEENDSS